MKRKNLIYANIVPQKSGRQMHNVPDTKLSHYFSTKDVRETNGAACLLSHNQVYMHVIYIRWKLFVETTALYRR